MTSIGSASPTHAPISHPSSRWYVWNNKDGQCFEVNVSGPTLDQLAYVYGWNPQEHTAFVRVEIKQRIGPLSAKRKVSAVIDFDMSRLRDEDFIALSKSALDALASAKPWPAWFDKQTFLKVSKSCSASMLPKGQQGTGVERRFMRPKVDRNDALFALYWPRHRVRSPPMSWHEIRTQVAPADRSDAIPAAQHLYPTWPVVIPGFVGPSSRSLPSSEVSGSLNDRLLRLAAVFNSQALPKTGSDCCLITRRTAGDVDEKQSSVRISIVKALGTDTKHVQGDVFLASLSPIGDDRDQSSFRHDSLSSSHRQSLFVALKRFELSPLDCPLEHLTDPCSPALLQQSPFIERLVLAMCSELVRQKVTQNLPIYYNWFYCTDETECAATQVKSTMHSARTPAACACMYISAEYAPLGNLHAHLKRFVECRAIDEDALARAVDNPVCDRMGLANRFVDLSLRALFFQILAGTLALHRYCGVTHGDLRWENILLQEIAERSGGHWHYRIDGRDYYVINSGGLVPILWDFGVSRIAHRGIANPSYRQHYSQKAKEVGDGSLHRIDLQALFYWPPLTRSLQTMMQEPFFDDALAFVRSDPTVDAASLIAHIFGSSDQFTKRPAPRSSACLGSFDLDKPMDAQRVTPSLIPFFKRSYLVK